MGLDRFVVCRDPISASFELDTAKAYIGDGGTVKTTKSGLVVIVLPGFPSDPRPNFDEDDGLVRFIEVSPVVGQGSPTICITTRNQDAFTNAVAEGLAKLYAQLSRGRILPV